MKKEDLKTTDDINLVNDAMAGNMTAFETIVRKYESMIAKITIPMIGNKDDANDIGQETFIRFYKSMKQFKGDSQLGTYLARIAINLSLNEIKRRKKRWLVSTDNYNNIEIPAVDNEKNKDITDLVNSSLEAMEPQFRSVIVLRHIQGFSTKETADILGIPQGTVLSRLSRGQDKLKEVITKIDGYEQVR